MFAIGARQDLPVSHPDFLVPFEAEKPTPAPQDLLVRVEAVAVNPVDTKIRASLKGEPLDPPRILGWDAAGVVEAVGAAVDRFAVGDPVFYAGDVTRPGSNAEFQCVDARLVAKMPTSWSFEDAAALPLVALTAWELLFERMGVDRGGNDAGNELLVINGAGGVGSAMIPLAKAAGLRVYATASRAETAAWCRTLGADEILNHREPLRPQAEALGVPQFPLIANLFNTELYWETVADLIAPLGAIGLIVEPQEKLHLGDPLKMKCARIAWEFMFARAKFRTRDMHRQGEILADIARRCDEGNFPKLATRRFDRLSVDNLRTAHEAMEKGRAHGKWTFTLAR